MRYRGYTGVSEYDPRTESFRGHIVDIEDPVNFEAVTAQRISREFRNAVDQYIDSMGSCEEEPAVPRRDHETVLAADAPAPDGESPPAVAEAASEAVPVPVEAEPAPEMELVLHETAA
jgi:predicted HicB family RNase H-like nuclease